MITVDTGYDDFAVVYDRHWAPRYAADARDTLDALLVPRVAAGSKVLDLCCGSGRISAALAALDFDVTGVDASSALLELARSNAPQVRFKQGDATQLVLAGRFQAAVCLNDSLNHLLTIEDLKDAFRGLASCMLEGSVLLFDLNLAHKYQTGWSGAMSIIEDDAVCAIVVGADLPGKLARFDAAVFRPSGTAWSRADVHLLQTWYGVDEVAAALEAAGFTDTRVTDRRGHALAHSRVDRAYFCCVRR
jgi:SAM-dependent methyltransferase